MPGDRKPPSEFWDKHIKIVKTENPDYNDEQASAVVAKMWQNAGPSAKAKYNKMRARREGELKKSESEEILDVQHIMEDRSEFEELKKHSKAITEIVEQMEEEDKDALKKKKKKRTPDDIEKEELEQSIHFIEVDGTAETPEGFETLEIRQSEQG